MERLNVHKQEKSEPENKFQALEKTFVTIRYSGTLQRWAILQLSGQ